MAFLIMVNDSNAESRNNSYDIDIHSGLKWLTALQLVTDALYVFLQANLHFWSTCFMGRKTVMWCGCDYVFTISSILWHPNDTQSGYRCLQYIMMRLRLCFYNQLNTLHNRVSWPWSLIFLISYAPLFILVHQFWVMPTDAFAISFLEDIRPEWLSCRLIFRRPILLADSVHLPAHKFATMLPSYSREQHT